MTKTLGSIIIPLKIFDITKKCFLFVVENNVFSDDILLGLDIIKEFRLCQDENLKICQNKKIEKKLVKKIIINSMTKEENKRPINLKEMLKKHKDIFAENKFDTGTVKDFEATIKLTQNRYIAKKPYKCSLQDKYEIED